LYLSDTICTGNEYKKNGFVLPVQDSVGSFVFVNKLLTTSGCDSITVLSLMVHPTPSINIELQTDSFICAGNATTLNAVSSSGSQTVVLAPKIVVGDILCTDGTTVSPSEYTSSGKVAKGVVCYVDNTGQHGWAMALNDVASPYAFSTTYVDIPGLSNFTTLYIIFQDLNGYSNTQVIRNAGTSVTYPAAYAVDFVNGWYIPSCAQLHSMVNISFVLEDAFNLVGSMMDDARTYISSTEYNSTYIWGYRPTGMYQILNKKTPYYIREVYSF
jgi:hypothetical protein